MVVDCETEVLNFLIKELREGADFTWQRLSSITNCYTHPTGIQITQYGDGNGVYVDDCLMTKEWEDRLIVAIFMYTDTLANAAKHQRNLKRKNHFCSLLNKIRN